jgi:hypothetical protein
MHTVNGLLATGARLTADSPILRGFQGLCQKPNPTHNGGFVHLLLSGFLG